ncbi:type II toxin-antitoxin system RelE/ParE family toxin [Flavobacterium foetidum]|uniref:type II toxin-antitoxin system RelE/ParE family toxin n=1 Tax=Flavobacterium foetidum TaxID=2026681 RepID=UPI001074A54D|nr:type II toxin-antitoxin system RelE/ParE family toxin [Flavobacterium foetidum]KAF2513835.1 type II toxin-antitoxin system RelE/ParE family toxin [Flavobacterium foetidum]
MKVVWSERAQDTFDENVAYLLKKWGENVTQNFENETIRVIDIICNNPHLGRFDKKLNCSIITIVKQVSLFYDVIDGKIVLIAFWDNRQKPLNYLEKF